MKNTLIAILVFGILIIGYLFIKEKTTPADYTNVWPETEPATSTNNQGVTNNNYSSPSPVLKTFSNPFYGFKIDYPAYIIPESEQVSEGSSQHTIYFGQDLVVRYTNDVNWFEEHELSGLEFVGSKTVNGNTFKIYQGQKENSPLWIKSSNTLWIKSGNEGWALNFADDTRMSLDTFSVI